MKTHHWLILAALFLCRFALGFQFQSIGSVAPFLVTVYSIGYDFVGLLIALFTIPGVLLASLSPKVAGALGDYRTIVFGLLLMAAGGVVSSSANTHFEMVLGRLMSGIGATFLLVLLTKLVIDHFPRDQIFLAMAIFIIGWPIGIAAGSAFQGLIAEMTGWSAAMYLTSAICLLACACFALVFRSVASVRTAQYEPSTKLSRQETKQVHFAGFIWMLLNGAYVVLLGFGPSLLVEREISVVEAGAIASLASWSFVMGLPIGGYIATRFQVPNLVVFVGLSTAAMSSAIILFTQSPMLAFTAFGIGLALATPVIGALPSRILKGNKRTVGLSIYFTWFFVGASLLPMMGGAVKAITGSSEILLLFVSFMLLCCLALFAVSSQVFRLSSSARANPQETSGPILAASASNARVRDSRRMV